MGDSGEGETQRWAEAVKGTGCPQPRRGHVPGGPRPLPSCPRTARGGGGGGGRAGAAQPREHLYSVVEEKGPVRGLAPLYMSQQTYVDSILRFGKWGSERLRSSPEITQPGSDGAQSNPGVSDAKVHTSKGPVPLPATGSSLFPRILPGGASLGGEPGPPKPTVPELQPGQMRPLPYSPRGSPPDGCVPFSLALQEGG